MLNAVLGGVLGRSWGGLGGLGAILRRSWGSRGRSWGVLVGLVWSWGRVLVFGLLLLVFGLVHVVCWANAACLRNNSQEASGDSF